MTKYSKAMANVKVFMDKQMDACTNGQTDRLILVYPEKIRFAGLQKCGLVLIQKMNE